MNSRFLFARPIFETRSMLGRVRRGLHKEECLTIVIGARVYYRPDVLAVVIH